MSGEKHTADQWSARFTSYSDGWTIYGHDEDGSYVVAEGVGAYADEEDEAAEGERLARLIAAAPEMFEVVKRVARLTAEGEDHAAFEAKYPAFAGLVRQAKEAVAKAQSPQGEA